MLRENFIIYLYILSEAGGITIQGTVSLPLKMEPCTATTEGPKSTTYMSTLRLFSPVSHFQLSTISLSLNSTRTTQEKFGLLQKFLSLQKFFVLQKFFSLENSLSWCVGLLGFLLHLSAKVLLRPYPYLVFGVVSF